MVKFYTGNIVPSPDTIFVFGSNPKGIHGAGSAKVALNSFGAVLGCGEGLMGNSYALPTTNLNMKAYGGYTRHSIPKDEIEASIRKMFECAKSHPEYKFKVAYRNSPDEVTLCGYTGRDLMNCFFNASDGGNYPDNVYFSKEWADSGLLEKSI